jgi:hypothetical protein
MSVPKESLFIFGGAIGDALLGIELQHTLEAADADTTLTLLSTRKSGFSRQVALSVPGLNYRELPPRSFGSWIYLLRLALTPHAVVFLEPFQDKVPLWWSVIARVATLMPGSVEVRCQSKPAPVPRHTRVVRYRCQDDNLFNMIARVPALWGTKAVPAPRPTLPEPECAQATQPFILFHFFAGAARRSWPKERALPLLKKARAEFPNHELVLTCAHGEEAKAEEMIAGVANTRIVISPSATELFCMLKQAQVVVGVASGVTHIASHLNVPAVIMCNLSDPCWLPTYAPKSLLLSAKSECYCNGDKTGDCNVTIAEGDMYRCLYFIKDEEILDGIRKFALA